MKHYEKQVTLLLEVLPFVAREHCFALKGGTAINLFVRNMPRLSVDIDLTYIPIEPRDITLENLTSALERIALIITQTLPNISTAKHFTVRDKRLTKLFIKQQETQITIEPNEILRGSVFPVIKADLCNNAKKMFERDIIDVNLLPISDLYAGKICAALDRQHPRDFFDIIQLFKNEGITKEIRQAFVIYLASGSRPVHELLRPNLIDIKPSFEKEFFGMSHQLITLDELIDTRTKLITEINVNLNEQERLFLLSIKQGDPQWDLLDLPGIENLPALKWKVMNVRKMEKGKHQQLIQKLKDVLQL